VGCAARTRCACARPSRDTDRELSAKKLGLWPGVGLVIAGVELVIANMIGAGALTSIPAFVSSIFDREYHQER
jgi:hypothetical protein